MKVYKHIFFDLDRTLWDFETNSIAALKALYSYHQLQQKGIVNFDRFIKKYIQINDRLWKHYHRGTIDKTALRINRFHKTFLSFGLDNYYLALAFGEQYTKATPLQTAVLPHTYETLTYLKTKYKLHIITNGFDEVQHLKLANCKLTDYFIHVITPENAGAQKPHPKIFDYALSLTAAKATECIMVGDHYEGDIVGARHAGIDQVYFTPHYALQRKPKATYCIQSLAQLKEIL